MRPADERELRGDRLDLFIGNRKVVHQAPEIGELTRRNATLAACPREQALPSVHSATRRAVESGAAGRKAQAPSVRPVTSQ